MLPKPIIEFTKQNFINTLKSSSNHKLPLVISKLPKIQPNTRVAQYRWKGLSDNDTYWTITRYKIKNGGHGKVWGRLTWKGKEVTKQPDQLIKGANKYNWRIIN